MDLVELKKKYPLQEIAKMIGVEISGESDHNVYGHCPFHSDSTPSFTISKSRQTARCFACSHLGSMDHVKLVQEYFHLNREQAEEKLYILVGAERPANSTQDFLSKALSRLTDNIGMDWPKEFFASRGIKESVLRDMMVGYSPSFASFKEMIKDIPPDEAARLELFRVELFENAIIYPSFDMLGRMAGFRSRPYMGFPKYITNRGEYPLKSARLYGQHSVRGRQIILVEGPNDVLALRSVGIHNVVGMMGLNVSGLDRYLDSFGYDDAILLTDGDEAGTEAMMRAPGFIRSTQVPEGLDPDEFAVKYGDYGKLAILDLVKNAEFPIQRTIKFRCAKVPSNLTGKIMLIKSVAREVAKGVPTIIMGKIQGYIADALQMPIEDVAMIFDMVDLDTSRFESAIIWHIHSGTDLGKDLGFKLHSGMFSNPYYRNQFDQLKMGLTPVEMIHEAKDLTDGDIEQFTTMFYRRKIKRILRTASGSVSNVSQPLEDSLNHLVTSLSDVTAGDIRVIDAQQQLDIGVQNAMEKMDQPGRLMGVSFGQGFKKMDSILSGIRPNSMYILAATQGVGKSNLGLQWALNLACGQGIPVLWLSLEMSEIEMSIRSLAKLTKLPARRIQIGDVNKETELPLLIQSSLDYGASPFYLASCGTIDIHQIISLTRKYKLTKGVQVVFIDYIQLIRAEEGSGMYEKVGAISRSIKNSIAMDRSIGIPVIAVAQLSKLAAKMSVPTGEQIAESYKIAQDADAIITLRRRDPGEIRDGQSKGKNLGPLQANVDKNRAGISKETIELSWNADNLIIEEV